MLLDIILAVITTSIGFFAGWKAHGTAILRAEGTLKNSTDDVSHDNASFDDFYEYIDWRYRISRNPPIDNFNWRCGIIQAMLPKDHPSYAKHQDYDSSQMKAFCDDLRVYTGSIGVRYLNTDKVLEQWFIHYIQREQRNIPLTGYRFKLQY